MTDQNNTPDYVRPGMTGDATPDVSGENSHMGEVGDAFKDLPADEETQRARELTERENRPSETPDDRPQTGQVDRSNVVP